MSSRRPHHSMTPLSSHCVSCSRGMAAGLWLSLSPTITNRASQFTFLRRALRMHAASTNSPTPLYHNNLDASMTTGGPAGTADQPYPLGSDGALREQHRPVVGILHDQQTVAGAERPAESAHDYCAHQ